MIVGSNYKSNKLKSPIFLFSALILLSFQTAKENISEDPYLVAIKEGKIVYTLNCGWIDKTHAFTRTKRSGLGIGVENLWSQLINETGVESRSLIEKGFKVTYIQDATIIQNIPLLNKPLRAGIKKEYFVNYGLSLEEKKKVGLAILKDVSIQFESFQALGFIIGRGASDFEPCDLISNQICFYRVVKSELTEDKILSLSHSLTPTESLNVYENSPGTFTDEKYKNRNFEPIYFSNDYCNSRPIFPKELNDIDVLQKNTLYREWNIHDENQ